MSTYLNYYIEYRKHHDDEWKLVSMMVPSTKCNYPEYCNKRVIDGVEYCISNSDSKQGHVRDVFSTHGWYCAPFTGRGFPNDMSRELKEYLDQCKAEEFERDKQNIDPDYEYKIIDGVYTIVPRTEPLSFEKDYVDYRYDKTWVTLSELSEFQTKELAEAEKRVREKKEKDKYTKLNERIDALETLILTGKKPDNNHKENDEENIGYLAELEEELDDAKWLGEWIYGINAIVDFYSGGWNDYENVRIITNLE